MGTAVLCRNFSDEVSRLVAQQEKCVPDNRNCRAEGERIERVGTDGLADGCDAGQQDSGIGGRILKRKK